MKKIIICITFIISGLAIFSGCTSKTYKMVKDNIAEVRYNIYVGESETLKGTFMSGKREKDYVINGYNTPLIEFGVLTLNLTNANVTNSNNAQYVITAGSNRYEGNLEINPFDNTYVGDIKIIIDIEEPIIVTIIIGSYSETINLQKQNSEWKVNHIKALEIACKELKNQLKEMIDGAFLGEVYVKIIYDDKIQENSYYWYVNFVGRKGITHSIIISPIGDILAKK